MARKWQILMGLAASTMFGTLAAWAQLEPLPVQPSETLGTVQEVTRSVVETVEDGVAVEADGVRTIPEPVGARLSETVQQMPVDPAASRLADIPVQDVVSSLPALISAPGRVPRFIQQDGWTVVENEWVVIVPTSEAARVQSLAIDVVEQTELLSRDAFLFVFKVRDDSADAATAEDLVREFGGELIDRNHVFRAAQGADQRGAAIVETYPGRGQGGRLGLIDTDVDESHSMLSNLQIAEADFVTIGDTRPRDHGTSVASIMARQIEPQRGELFAASAFYRTETGATGATSASLVKAIDWLVANQVRVINFSLTGPPNRTLETMVEFALAEGITIVAAVGNDGPAARPLYPAAYDGVVGVTAVDQAGTPYRWANRGDYVDVAAIGVGVEVALPGNRKTLDSGTSYAAPVVSAYLAMQVEPSSVDVNLQRVVQPSTPDNRSILGAGLFIPDEN